MKRLLLLAVALVAIWIVAMYAMSLVAGVLFTLIKFVVAGLIAVVAVRYLARYVGRRGELGAGRRRRQL